MIFESELPGASLLSELVGRYTSPAQAATGAGAPPAMEAVLPDVGMERKASDLSTGTNASPNWNQDAASNTAPGAVPGIATQNPTAAANSSKVPTPGSESAADRALPSIRQSAARSSANGTSTSLSREVLARRQEDLSRKEQELKSLEGELSTKLDKLQVLENRLSVMIKEAEETKDAKFRHLVDVLSNMKAKQAAAVLETLDQKIAVRVLAGMRGRQAGEILTFVKAEKAALLTEELARMQLPLE